jgi:hypothetical protein
LLDTPRESEHLEHLLREADRLCRASGTRLVTAQPLSLRSRGELLRFAVQIQVDGRLDAITELLLQTRETRPLLDIERVSLRAVGDDGVLSAQLQLASYAWAPPKSRAKPRIAEVAGEAAGRIR